jgi:hypothetical protein
LGERLLVIVPMVGAGTAQDPRRPLFMPLGARPLVANQNERPPILNSRFELSDDGKTAILLLTAQRREAFQEVRTSGRADIQIFEVGKDKKEDIQAAFRRHKRDFDLMKFVEGR